MNYMQLSITTVEHLALAITLAKYEPISALNLDQNGFNWMTIWSRKYLSPQFSVVLILIERHTFCFIGENVTEENVLPIKILFLIFEFLLRI